MTDPDLALEPPLRLYLSNSRAEKINRRAPATRDAAPGLSLLLGPGPSQVEN